MDIIWISCQKKEERLQLSIYNTVLANLEKKESTGIGLSTCKRLIKQMGGTFCAEDDGSCFAVTMELPLL